MAKQESTAALVAAENYRRWQRLEEQADLQKLAEWQDRVIATGDPECEQLIAALEVGWLKDSSR